jgi:hypothetical protein
MPDTNSAVFTADAVSMDMIGPGETRLRRSWGNITVFEKIRTAGARRRSVFTALPRRAIRQPLGSR